MTRTISALAMCAFGVVGIDLAEAQTSYGPDSDYVLYRITETVETEGIPMSQVEERLQQSLVSAIDEGKDATRRDLRGLDVPTDYVGALESEGTRDPRTHQDSYVKFLGERAVTPQSGGIFSGLMTAIGVGESTDGLPTIEEHVAGVAKLQTTFLVKKTDVGKLGRYVGNNQAWPVSDRASLAIIASDQDGNLVRSQNIHITMDELRDLLSKSPREIQNTELGKLLRSVYRNDIVGVPEGAIDHDGIDPEIVVFGVDKATGPGVNPGPVLAGLENPNDLLDRRNKHGSMTPDEVSDELYRRNRRQFRRERDANRRKQLEAANPPPVSLPASSSKGASDRLNGLLGD